MEVNRRVMTKFASCLLAAALMLAVILAVNAVSVHADDTAEMPDNGIPVLTINIDETQGTIEDMNSSTDHSVYCYGTVSIDVPEGFHYSDFPDLPCESFENLAMSIRGRGNSTWRAEKKPYKIKLDKKKDLFGLGENKHWVIVANSFDETQIRDRITAWLGDKMGFEFTPRGVPVDVVMIGQDFGTHYLGSYYFSENVRVDTNRLEIEELKESDTELPTITGGYLVQDGTQVDDSSADIFYTSRGVRWATDTPSFDVKGNTSLLAAGSDNKESDFAELLNFPELGDAYENHAQQDYIRNYTQYIEDVLYKGDDSYRDVMDVESAAKYWLIQAFTMNNDAYHTGSTYFYKRRDTESGVGLVYWGPLWDFDFGWDHVVREPVGFETDHTWVRPMLHDTGEGGFTEEVKAQWTVLKPALEELIADGGIIDQYAAETKASAEADYQLYNPGDDSYDYLAEVEELKDWTRNRLAWVDANLDEIDDLVRQVRLTVDGELYENVYALTGRALETNIDDIAPEKDGCIFIQWLDENGQPFVQNTPIEEDMTLTAEFLSKDEAVMAEDIVFRRDRADISYNFFVAKYEIPYSIFPPNADDTHVRWSSSDEEFALVNQSGLINYRGTGEAVITATLSSGKTKSFVFTVSSDGLTSPDAISIDKDDIRLTVGDQDFFTIATEPEKAFVDHFSYESLDESVATVDEYGIITAVGPGKTQIKVGVSAWAGAPVEAYADVTVTESKPTPESKSIEGAKLVLSKTAYTYNGKVRKPAIKTIGGEALKAGTDYTVKWSNASSRKVGTYTVTITGKGSYTGVTSATYKINPKGTSLKTPKKAKAKKSAITVKWKKQSAKMSKYHITGYQIQLATDSKFTKNKKTVTVKGYRRTSKKITKLKSGRKYYIRIRTYKTVKGKKYYSAWSK